MELELGRNKRIGASDRQGTPEIEKIEVRQKDMAIINKFIQSELEKLKKIENQYWRERWTNFEIITCVQIDKFTKTAWIHEKHPHRNTFELRQIEQKIYEIGEWEITVDFDVVQSARDIIHTKFHTFLHQLKELAKNLPRIDNLRNYLMEAGGWKLYKFANVYDWGENSYKFYCYRIKNNKAEFKGGYVEFDKSHNPNVWLFTDIANLIESNYEPLIHRQGAN